MDDTSRQNEPYTLLAIQTSIFRYIRDNNYKYNIKQDQQFRHSRQVLTAKMKELKQLGKGNHPKAFTADELDKLLERKVLGTSKKTYLCFVVYILYIKTVIFCTLHRAYQLLTMYI